MTETARHGGEQEAGGQLAAMLRRLASTDDAGLAVVAGRPPHFVSTGLDDRIDALVRLAALVAMAAPATAYRTVVDAARHAGATDAELIGTMIAVAPTVGLARLIPAAAGVSLALGNDVDAALERSDELVERSQPKRGDVDPPRRRATALNPEHEELLRRLALNDPREVEAVLGAILHDPDQASSLAKLHALCRLAALIGADSASASYRWAVEAAMSAGASEADIADVLVAVVPIVGRARLTGAARELAHALDYDDETTPPA